MMQAIAVFPGQPNSVHLTQMAKPSASEIPDGRGVLVKVLRVGVDGTDKEINAAEYGAAPEGFNFLVVGHESFGQVEEVGANVTELAPGDYVVADDSGVVVIPAEVVEKVTDLAEERDEVDKETMAAIGTGATIAETHRHFRDDDVDWYRRVE